MDNFKGFIGYSEEEFKDLWDKAIFTVDTNVLLNFYKYTSQESKIVLLNILKELKRTDRLWVSHQVALEYFFNYEATMSKPHEGYDFFQKELKKLDKNTGKILSTVSTEHPYIDTEEFEVFIDEIKKLHEAINEKVNEELDKLPKAEEIKGEILSLLEGVVGEAYTQEKIDAIEKEGSHRYSNEVPPGFKDNKDKKNVRTYGTIKYSQQYGDLLLWYQMIDKASEVKAPIIFITEEKAEDWWEKSNQSIKRPQPHLIQEFIEKSTQIFYMYRTEMFIKYASQNLKLEITDEEVESVAKDVEKIRRLESRSKKNKNILYKDILGYSEKTTLLDKVSLNSLSGFLSKEEKINFSKKIKKHLSDKGIDNFNDEEYRKIIEKTIYQVHTRVENKVETKLNEILELNFDVWESFAKKISECFGSVIERTIMLMEYLEEMEHWLDMEGLPF